MIYRHRSRDAHRIAISEGTRIGADSPSRPVGQGGAEGLLRAGSSMKTTAHR
jgi:hypothetical protein